MAYSKRVDIPGRAGEIVVELDTGALVVVRCDRKRVDAGIAFHATARAIEEGGEAVLDSAGQPISTELKHSVPIAVVEQFGADAIARDCMLAVLGEPPQVVAWSETLLTSVSIRVSLAAGPAVGVVDAGAVL